MPLYEYQCTKCRHTFEKIESFSASVTKKCPKCGGKAERQLSPPAVQFKGSGWYVTDYARKTSGGDGGHKEAPAASETKSESKLDGAAASKESAPAEKHKKKK